MLHGVSTRPLITVGFVVVFAACAGTIDDPVQGAAPEQPRVAASHPGAPPPPMPVPPASTGGAGAPAPAAPGRCGAAPRPGPSPLRRLTRAEYDATVAALLGDTSRPAAGFPNEEKVDGFDNNALVQGASDLLIENYEAAAQRLAREGVADVPRLLGCDPRTQGEDACVAAFVPRFGLRAYRRPLEKDEQDRLLAFYAKSRQAYGFTGGVRLVLQAMLQSPHLLYRIEKGVGAGPVAALTGYERATRLAYLLTGGPPDTQLLDAARSGALEDATGVSAAARRLVGGAGRVVRDFASQWLELGRVEAVAKDARLFPSFTAPVRTLLRQESERFVEAQFTEPAGTVARLFTGAESFLNRDLARYYGVMGPAGAALERVALDGTRAAGVLTQAAILAAQASAKETNPVARGLFVREHFLCAPPPPPPAGIDTKLPEADGKVDVRERLARHREDPACSGCHALLDPIGFGFERHDAIGLWRTASPAPDASGEILGTRDANGPFVGVPELAARLARSGQVHACVVETLFRYANGRSTTDEDDCALGALTASLTASGGKLPDLLVALTGTDAFLYRTNEPGGAP